MKLSDTKLLEFNKSGRNQVVIPGFFMSWKDLYDQQGFGLLGTQEPVENVQHILSMYCELGGVR